MSAAARKQKIEIARKISIAVELPLRDRLKLEIETDDVGEIVHATLSGSGCLPFLTLIDQWRPKLSGRLDSLPSPQGSDHADILLREAILKAQGRWSFPYQEDELCHCRAVRTDKVDAAIIGGCKSVKSVSRETSAGTSCGTCRPDIEAILNYRLFNKS